jgi:hypothetical protein
MHVQSAIHGAHCLHLRIDGHRLRAGEKYTIIEMGYAILLPDDDDNSGPWLARITETIPHNPEDGRGPLTGGECMAVTSNPIVVALSYADWWARNTDGFKAGRSLRIPSQEEAVQIVRRRRILNDFNRRYEGKLASE